MSPVEWLKETYGAKPSELGANVARVLEIAGNGLHNAPINPRRIEWGSELNLTVVWGRPLCNWDGCSLTAIWAWCAELRLRVEIEPCSPTHLRLNFSQRDSREGAVGDRLPDARGQIAWVGLKP